MLLSGQYINWVELVVMAKISDLHLGAKLMSQPVKDPMLKYPMPFFPP